MPSFLSGVVSAWFRGKPGHSHSGGAADSLVRNARARNALAHAAFSTIEALEERKLFAVTTLTNGTGEGTLRVTVDAYGAYGSAADPAGDAFYNPIGPGGSEGTTFESGVYFDGIDNFLSQGTLSGTGNLPEVPFSSTSATRAVSSFRVGQYDVTLTQEVDPPDGEGTTMTQTYRITNNTGSDQSIRLVRHVDGDLDFIPGLDDDAGVTTAGDFVFEFDTARDPSQAVGFFGITATGGRDTGYAIQPYQHGTAGYFDNIVAANGIPGGDVNTIRGPAVGQNADTNNDRLTDQGYDVTISLQTEFDVAAGATITYTTVTRFGQGSPAEVIGQPRLQFTAATYSRSEGARQATITVTREGGRAGAASVNFTTIDGTATAGEDYIATSGTLEFAGGETRASFTIPIIDDDILDGDETVIIRLSEPSTGVVLGTPNEAVLNIIDDTPFLQFTAPAFTVVEDEGVAQIVVERSGSTQGEARVDFTTGGGTATPNVDYTPVSGTLLFANGQREAVIEVPIVQDAILEDDELVEIVLSNSAGASLGTPIRTTLTIVNFEAPPTIIDLDTVGFNDRIDVIVLHFNTDLDPERAETLTNYDLFKRRERPLGGSPSRNRIKIRSANYDPATQTVALRPRKPLRLNRFYELSVSGTRTGAVSGIGGTPLDGNQDLIPGDNYRNYFGRGNKLSYYDREGDHVTLQTHNGGLMDIDRPAARDTADVELLDVFQRETILSGSVSPSRRVSDGLAHITLFNSTGVGLDLPPQIIIDTPDLPPLPRVRP